MSLINYQGDLVETIVLKNFESDFLIFDFPVLQEKMYIKKGDVYFWEAHYFKIMSSMRQLKMNISENFTMGFLKDEIMKTILANGLDGGTALGTFYVFKKEKTSLQNPLSDVGFCIKVKAVDDFFYNSKKIYSLGSYQDHYLPLEKDNFFSLSSFFLEIKNRALSFAFENRFTDSIVLNTNKNIAQTALGSIFLVENHTIKTPPLSEGCEKSVFRNVIYEKIVQKTFYKIIEVPLSIYDLQKSDEAFVVSETGIQNINKYYKKEYDVTVTLSILKALQL